jgi:hypothetical protein
VERERLFEELLVAAEKLGVEVRVEPFETGGTSAGGICKLRGRRLILLDAAARVPERSAALARVLSDMDHERVYVAPRARDYICAEQARRMNR